jgi:hypothetical protein
VPVRVQQLLALEQVQVQQQVLEHVLALAQVRQP